MRAWENEERGDLMTLWDDTRSQHSNPWNINIDINRNDDSPPPSWRNKTIRAY